MTSSEFAGMPDPLAAFSDRLAALAAAAGARTVAVHGRDGRRPRSGLIWADGLVVTAEEALERDDDITLTLPDGRRVPATLAGRDPGTDVALLRAETGPAEPLPLAPPGLAAGHVVLAAGRGEHGAFAGFGVVALADGAWRSMRGGRIERRLHLGLRLEAEAEGGPVLDHAGRLVGMAVPGPKRQVLAIPAETIARVVEVLRTRGRVARGYLGLATQPVGLPGGKRGVIVVGIDPDGPGARGGVLLGDVITAMNRAPVAAVRDLLSGLDPETIGRDALLDLLRAGAPLRVTVRIAERAAPC